MSEPAILVRRLTGSQVWSMEKLENKLIDMREMYQEHKERPAEVNLFLCTFIRLATLTNITKLKPKIIFLHPIAHLPLPLTPNNRTLRSPLQSLLMKMILMMRNR